VQIISQFDSWTENKHSFQSEPKWSCWIGIWGLLYLVVFFVLFGWGKLSKIFCFVLIANIYCTWNKICHFCSGNFIFKKKVLGLKCQSWVPFIKWWCPFSYHSVFTSDLHKALGQILPFGFRAGNQIWFRRWDRSTPVPTTTDKIDL